MSDIYFLKFLLSVWLISALVFGWIMREDVGYDLEDYLIGTLILSVATTLVAGFLWIVFEFLFFYWG